MWVYILASQKNCTLYVGVTNRLSRRVQAHRDGEGSEFAHEHRVFRLVYAEHYDTPRKPSRRKSASSIGVETGRSN